MNTRARNHSIVAEQWVCAWLRPQTVRVPSPKSRQDSKRLRTWQATKIPVADRSLEGRGGEHLSMRRLVAEKGELGEDHSECTSDQQLQPGVVEEDQPGHRTTRRGQQTSEFNGTRRPRRKVLDSPSRGPGRHQRVRKRLPRIIDRWEAEGVTNTLDVWEICRGDPDLEWLAHPSIDVSAAPPHTESEDSDGG